MAKRIWEINLEGKTHVVQIKHGYWSGKREIMVDGKLVVKGRGINASGVSHIFNIDEYNCELHIATNGFVYRYILFVDGTPYIAQNDSPKDTIIQAAIKDGVYWRTISKFTGLRYIPVPQARGIWRHRLVGSINGYMLGIRLGQLDQRPILAASVVVRFASVLNPDELKLQLSHDSALSSLTTPSENRFSVTESQIWIGLPYEPQKETAELFAKRLKDLVNTLSKFVSPLRNDVCDSHTCKRKWEQPLFGHICKRNPVVTLPRMCQRCAQLGAQS